MYFCLVIEIIVNIFVLEVWDDEGAECTFYTVRYDTEETNETDDFFLRYEKMPEFEKANQELLTFILESIGNEYGALDQFFNRSENEVWGLPSKGKIKLEEIFWFPDFPLRIYALKITDEIVILFNGGIKDGNTNQNSSLHLKWLEACEFAKRIIEAIKDKTIIIDTYRRKLKNFDDSDEIIL